MVILHNLSPLLDLETYYHDEVQPSFNLSQQLLTIVLSPSFFARLMSDVVQLVYIRIADILPIRGYIRSNADIHHFGWPYSR